MENIVKTKERTWRVQVRRKGVYASQIFRVKMPADEWIVQAKRLIDIGLEPSGGKVQKRKTIGDFIDLRCPSFLDTCCGLLAKN